MADAAANPFLSKTIGAADTQSRAKAEQAAERADAEQQSAPPPEPVGEANPLTLIGSWPMGANGTPMLIAQMAASELMPTGQYANVSIGPARLTFLIDPDRDTVEKPYFTQAQRDTIAKALNEAAEIVEGDVVAVQRNLVMESMQAQVAADTNGK